MQKNLLMREELKKKFIQDLNPSEQYFFLKRAKEAIMCRRYPVSEDLYHYCYFLTIKERIRNINGREGIGFLRFMIVDAMKEVEEAIKLYQDRLEKRKLSTPDIKAYDFLKFLSE